MSLCIICSAEARGGKDLRLHWNLEKLLEEKYHKHVITTDLCHHCKQGLRRFDVRQRKYRELNTYNQDFENWIKRRQKGKVKRVKKEKDIGEVRKSTRPSKKREDFQSDAKNLHERKKKRIVSYVELFSCEQKDCHNIFEDCNSFIRHNIKVHGISYRCEACDINFETKTSLIRHKGEMHTYTCISCRRTFIPEGLKIHKIYHRQGKKKQCGLCDKSFDSYCVLLEHLIIGHTDIISLNDICCPYCPDYVVGRKTVAFMTHLTVGHGDIIQGEEILAKCDQCGKYFGSKQVLEDHKVEGHMFSCFICKMYFSDEGNLIEHMHTCRKESNTCEVCNESFPDTAELMTHKSTHKNEFCERNICVKVEQMEYDLYSEVDIKQETVVNTTDNSIKEDLAVHVKEEIEGDPLAVSELEQDFESLVKTESAELRSPENTSL